MKTILDLVAAHGGLDALAASPIRIPARGGLMRLVVEHIGLGPRGLPLISIAHYYEQAGDLMRDPEITAELAADGRLHPVSFTQDNLGLYQEAVFTANGSTMVRPGLVKQLTSFMRVWDRNLRSQKYLEAYTAAAEAGQAVRS